MLVDSFSVAIIVVVLVEVQSAAYMLAPCCAVVEFGNANVGIQLTDRRRMRRKLRLS
jgi:hypothetical protein